MAITPEGNHHMDAIEAKTRQTLKAVQDAGTNGFYASVKAMAANVAGGMVMQNPTMKDDKGNIATKLTQFGAAYLASPEGTDPATLTADKTTMAPDVLPTSNEGTEAGLKAAGSISTIAGKDGKTFARIRMSLPKSVSTGRTSSYPVDDLLPPDADGNLDGMFLEPSDKVKDPSKAYPAVASAATKRWKKLNAANASTPIRTFTSRVMDGAPFGKPGVNGVGIFRTE
jgi:hypothetical protein